MKQNLKIVMGGIVFFFGVLLLGWILYCIFSGYISKVPLGQIFGGSGMCFYLLMLGRGSILEAKRAKKVSKIIGKTLLVGLTKLDSSGELKEHIEAHGRIISADESAIVIDKADGTGHFRLPPDYKNIFPAGSGEYTLKSTGEVVSNPDFVSTWEIHEPIKTGNIRE